MFIFLIDTEEHLLLKWLFFFFRLHLECKSTENQASVLFEVEGKTSLSMLKILSVNILDLRFSLAAAIK